MFTPQEIREKTFEKAVFGGYDMQTVDEFLEPLTADYITLYKENAVLKSKMRVLVEKLEEYRAQEQSMRKAIVSAQRTADAMVAEAERKCARLVSEAQSEATAKAGNADELVAREQERLNNAKKTAKNFIAVVEQDIRGHLELLEKLKAEDLTEEEPQQPPRAKPFDFEQSQMPPVTASSQTQAEIADEIEQNIGKIMDAETPENPKTVTDATIKFSNLQFGRNYDPIME